MRGLSEKEWNELVSLEYILTWNFTDDYDRDEKRYKELSEKRWKNWELQDNRKKKLDKLKGEKDNNR